MDDIWYVSDEYPRHITPNLALFEKYKAETVGTSATGEAGLNVQGVGEVLVRTETKNFVIPGVFYVPNAGLNTLSLSQLMQQGFEVVFKNTSCIVKRLFDDTSSEGSSSNDEGAGCMEEKEKLNLDKERAVKAIMEYCDSLYFKENTIEENLNGDHRPRVPSKYEFESLIGFIEMVNKQEIKNECKDLVKHHFGKMVQWFYKEFMKDEERIIPVKINGIEICLLDLYLTVKGMGGNAQVTIKNKWIGVAYAMGFPREYADGLKECYGTHLSLLEAYYELAKEYSSSVTVLMARECMGAGGIMAKELPGEETRPCCSGTEARQSEEGIKGRIEFDKGEELIITFEDCKDEEPMGKVANNNELGNGSGEGMNVDQSTTDGDYIIVDE